MFSTRIYLSRQSEVSQRELGARVDPHHEPAGAVRLEGGGDDDVAAGAELEAGEDLSVVDVGAGGALVVVVLEVLGRQPGVALVRTVQAETDLEKRNGCY